MKYKFRLWDKINKCFATDFTLTLDGELLCDNGTTLFIKDNFELMQWAGLQDRNGKDIYEGDIWAGPYFDANDKEILMSGIIVFNRGAFQVKYNEMGYSATYTNISYVGKIEIIGNIYSNPELLEQA
jgi:uncharacterized phage protein (TIGR01671 family)